MRRGAWIGAGTAACVIVAVISARHATPADGSPVEPGGAWRWLWAAALVVGFVLYGAGVLAARRRGALTLAAAVVVSVVVQLAPLGAPLLLSRDVYLYWAQARVVTVHHANPYVVVPGRYARDPATRIASAQWRTETEDYGPGWVGLGTLPALAAGSSHARAEWLYRVLAAAGVLAAVAVVARRTRSSSAVAFLGWSPLLALHFAGGGHNDAWLAVALVLAVAAGDSAGGGLAWAVGASLKSVPVILLPLELARARFRFSRRFWAGLVGGGLAIAAVSTAFFGVRWVGAAAVGAHSASPIGGVHFLTEAGLRHRDAVALGGLVFVAVYAVLLRQAWVNGRARLSLAATALCFCSSLLRPWYAIWPVALAAVEEDAFAQVAAYALSAYLLFGDAVHF